MPEWGFWDFILKTAEGLGIMLGAIVVLTIAAEAIERNRRRFARPDCCTCGFAWGEFNESPLGLCAYCLGKTRRGKGA